MLLSSLRCEVREISKNRRAVRVRSERRICDEAVDVGISRRRFEPFVRTQNGEASTHFGDGKMSLEDLYNDRVRIYKKSKTKLSSEIGNREK